MTIADVLSRWRCDAAVEATKVAENYEYGVSCPTDLCERLRKIWALQLVRDNASCTNAEKVQDWLMPGSITPVTATTLTESDTCSLSFTDITTSAGCTTGLTFSDINPLTGS